MSKLRKFLDQFGDAIAAAAEPRPITLQPPSELHFELTYRCNTACVMCNLRHLSPNGPELALDDIKKMVGQSTRLAGITYIVLSGGEAFMREDLVDIVAFLHGQYPRAGVLILSNLIDTALVMSQLQRIRKRVGVDFLSIGTSLDGIGPAHDRIRGKAGSFEALNRTIAAIKKDYPSVFFSFNFTLTPENHDQIMTTFTWANEHNYHISYQVMVQKQETKKFTWEAEQIDAVDRQITDLCESLCRRQGITHESVFELLSHEGLLSQVLGLHYIPRYIRQPRRYFSNCPCGAKYAMIDPRGNVYFCPVHKTAFAGSVHARSFDALWESDEAAAARNFFNRRDCHCWLTCTNGYMLGTAIADGKNTFIQSLATADPDA